MRTIIYILFILIVLVSCEKIETGKNLNNSTIKHIKSIGLLEEGEHIINFYSNYQKDKAGNFFTNKRIAHYWIDKEHPDQSDTTFAFYKDIIAIDTLYKAPDFDAPYMTVTKSDSSQFRVYAEGDKIEIQLFYENAIAEWKKNKVK